MPGRSACQRLARANLIKAAGSGGQLRRRASPQILLRASRVQVRKSAMTFAVAARTRAQRIPFDTVPIVPSISSACTTLQAAISITNAVWPRRQILGRIRSGLRRAASRAAPNTAHMATTPKGENGVGEVKSSASITSGGLVTHRPATWLATTMTSAIPTAR